jgi:hypothetical protein
MFSALTDRLWKRILWIAALALLYLPAAAADGAATTGTSPTMPWSGRCVPFMLRRTGQQPFFELYYASSA